MKVVVVESPAKAKTINKYLGSDYKVLASYGHIRDLPSKDGSVDPEADFAMIWEAQPRAEKQIKEIASAVKGAESLYLATDPDREGEAISWHVQNVLSDRKALKGVDVKRVVFNEITKRAVLDAIDNPRDLDQDLVDAYLARRALDYLVGFTLSPVLWRKLPGSRSAGRVQSVALRLICEREAEIEAFRSDEYWTIDATFRTKERKNFVARLTHLDGEKLEKLSIGTEAAAKAAVERLEGGSYTVRSLEKKQTKRNPYPPFTTSTLQQEASRKLGFGASRTMQLAQKLYEGIDLGGETVGLITYMRTDGVQLSQEAVFAIRDDIGKNFGDRYLPNSPRMYKNKAKNAQEAHEAIRPTDVRRHPKQMAAHLDKDMARLYELIWKRSVACQMASAELDQTTAIIGAADKRAELRATGSIITFDGFLKLYQETRDDPAQDGDEDGKLLPAMAEGEALAHDKTEPEQHFTQPPPRYSEASLVKKLEELGIGRPSTYASILQVLQDRNYVRLDKRRFIPEDRGRLVTTFLSNFFTRYVQYNFTAEMEDALDNIAEGTIAWKKVLQDFWQAFHAAVDNTKDLKISDVLNALDEELGPHFFPVDENGESVRACPTCSNGRLGLKLGKFGAFIGCSNYPECKYTRQMTQAGDGSEDGTADLANGPKILGQDPATGLDVSLRKGPYGTYVQLGEKTDDNPKPKRASLTKGMNPAEVTLETALSLLALPREVGPDPESGEIILAGIGRYGPYLKIGSTYISIPAGDDVLTIGINRAVDLIANNPKKKNPAKALGDYEGKPITVGAGRFGPYVKHQKIYATIPKSMVPEEVTLEQAIELIKAKAEKTGAKKAPAKKTPAKKATAKKSAAKKKPAAKKTAAKKSASDKDSAQAAGDD
ncbi:type I DNA topoisomerase [Nisaea acidiphila]|uniref:DNA topoisomerase 1 n=1 Tax=Nisaea acidiphila TaxID=1862145 RepID=A0A9J7ATA5_9PROT|nr:type I DNA topoisomerase [Nisaea acidiphila]UUX50923.1 type I DNA topoisomerase [Nisaea acidiphila]